MEQTQAVGEGLVTFEQFMAGMQELRKNREETDCLRKETEKIIQRIARRQKETARQMKETDKRMEETACQMKETDKRMQETDKRMQETDKRLSKFTNRFGEMVEYMIVPNLVARFRELHFEFEKTHRNTEIVDRAHDIILEVDAFLENGDKVMIVEIKNKPNTDDVDDHVERMEKLRRHADLHNDKRKYLGAMAGVVFSESAKIYALKKGFYVIEPSGETFVITEPKGKYHPHEW